MDAVRSDPSGSLASFLADDLTKHDHGLFMSRMDLLGKSSVPGLLEYVRTSSPCPTQFSALYAIRDYGDESVCSNIAELITRPDSPLWEKAKYPAYETLARHGGGHYLGFLRAHFDASTNRGARLWLADVLTRMQDDSCRDFLLELLRTGEGRNEREFAGMALSRLYGTDQGTNAAAWTRWLQENGKLTPVRALEAISQDAAISPCSGVVAQPSSSLFFTRRCLSRGASCSLHSLSSTQAMRMRERSSYR
jgi:hypothetical protein